MWWLADSLCKRHAIICKNFDTLFAHGFRFYFTPLKAVLFTFPSRYLFTIGCWLVFSLTGWSPLIHMRFLVSHVTLDIPSAKQLNQQGYHLLWHTFPSISVIYIWHIIGTHCPFRVWTTPISLAATFGIAFALFSLSYWDVSLQTVLPPTKMRATRFCVWVIPFGDP